MHAPCANWVVIGACAARGHPTRDVRAERAGRARARDVGSAERAVVRHHGSAGPRWCTTGVLAGCGAPCAAPSWARGPAAARRVGRATSACSGRCGTAGTDTPGTPGAPARVRSAAVPRTRHLPVGGVLRCWSHTPSTARRSPRRLRDCRDDTGPWQTNWARCLCDGVVRACHYTPHSMPKPGFGPPQPAAGCRTHPRTPCQSPALACRSLWRSVGRAPQR